ncbi:MAG: LysM peptidoglycan-binding domain-containing protein, partial [Ilumatobacteraceae bacterium]
LVYTVVAGDYLSGIATRMGVKLSVLLSTNSLTATSVIHPGTQLTVPAGGILPVTKVVPIAAPAAAAVPAPAATLEYVVRSGDYLTGIAPALGVKVSDLLAANKLTLTSVIYPGMRLAVPAGGRLPVSTPAAAPAIVTTDSRLATVLTFAQAQLGKPYKFNAAGPDSWDCSGLTMAAFAEIGISLPHYSGAQVTFGTAVEWTTQPVQAGDLIFLESSVGSGVINHVGIAISATQWIQAPRSGDVVRIGSIPSTRVIAVRRLVAGG